MVKGLRLKEKAPLVTTDSIEVRRIGPKRDLSTAVYLYADVLEELLFNASHRRAIGVLVGRLYLYPEHKGEAGADQAVSLDMSGESSLRCYIEVMAFKDIYPAENALDYCTYLRRQRDFRNVTDDILSVGSVFMSQERRELMLEDLLLQRSYFADEYQIALFVSSDGQDARVFMLDDESDSFVEVGYYLVSLRA